MKRTVIDKNHPLFSVVVGRVAVHNAGGECSVGLHEEARAQLQQLEEGHYMLGVLGIDLDENDEMAVASVTVRDGAARIYPERTVPELAVGEHDLVVSSFHPTANPIKYAKP